MSATALHRIRRTAIAAVLGTALALSQAAPALAVTLTPVLTSPRAEEFPTANAAFLAWSQNSKASPKHFDVFARKGQAPRFKVDVSGTQAFTGGIDGNMLVYQQIKNGQANIELFNLQTHARSSAPPQVNTTAWEGFPTMFGHFLLFMRGEPATKQVRQVILFNTETKSRRSWPRPRAGSRCSRAR